MKNINKPNEDWRAFRTTIKGTYEVSTMGRVRLVNDDGEIIRIVCSYYSGGIPNSRYLCLSTNEMKYVHRAVAISFIPNPHNLPCVNHKNGIKTDNRVENLEWCTYKENAAHYNNMRKAKVSSSKTDTNSKINTH